MRRTQAGELGSSFRDRSQEIGDHFAARFRAEVPLTMHADADGVGFHVAVANHEHCVHFHLLGAGDFGFDVVAARVELGTDFFGAQFGLDGTGVFEQRRFIADRKDAHLLGRKPQREVAGIMLDQEADESFVCA